MRWILLLLVVLGVGAALIIFTTERIDTPPPGGGVPQPRVEGPSPPSRRPIAEISEKEALLAERTSFVLLFTDPGGEGLRPETRTLRRPPALRDAIQSVLEELIHGSRTGLLQTLPRSTKVLEVFLDGKGTAYVDFSKEVAAAHPGGVWAEALSVASVVQTVTANFKAVRKVLILIEGKTAETLAGHIDVRGPLTRLDTQSALAGADKPSRP